MEDVFELISDIHIDHWDFNYKAKYPCCNTKPSQFMKIR